MSFAMISYVDANGFDKMLVLGAVILASLTGACLLSFSAVISRALGKEPIRGLEKITAILLAVIACEMIMSGIKGYFF